MIFRPLEAVRGRGSIAAASECVFRNRRHCERCTPPPVCDGLLLPWYSAIVVVVDSDDYGGGGVVLPAFPSRFSHHRGILVSYINSRRPQQQYHIQSFLRLTNNIVTIQKYTFKQTWVP